MLLSAIGAHARVTPADKLGVSTKVAVFFVAALTAARAQTAMTVTAMPASLSFSYQIGAALPAAQAVSVRASSGTPSYTAAISPSDILWMTVIPDSGALPASLSVRVNPTGLAVGTYVAHIDVAVAGMANPTSAPVTLTVTAPPPTLALSATTVNFVNSPAPSLEQTVTLSTSGTPISFTAAVSGAKWLTLAPATGVVLPGRDVTLSMTADPTGLAPQAKAYTGKVTITATGVAAASKSQIITANLTVNPQTPTIASLWPGTVQANAGAATITVRGTGFYASTTATAGTTALATTILSATILQAVVPANLLTTAGAMNIVVSNPAPGGDSQPAVLTISDAPVVQAIVNAASYGGATTGSPTISPGEIVALFGLGIGPATPVFMSTSGNPVYVDTTVGGVAVTIDGQAAPLLYADANQITVQAPYEISAGSDKVVTVVSGTTTATAPTVTVAGAAPGIFTADASGVGQAAAVVYPVTGPPALNGTASPARAGDTIALYLTGEGDYVTDPTPHTGYIIPAATETKDLPQMPTLPTVTVGGTPATVGYAGPIVGGIVGLLQINVVVPAGLKAGNAQVVVTIGGIATQPNVTVAVK